MTGKRLRVGARVRVVPTSPISGHVGCRHVVTELFELAGVLFAVLTPEETPIPPIVAVDELIPERPRGGSRLHRRRWPLEGDDQPGGGRQWPGRLLRAVRRPPQPA